MKRLSAIVGEIIIGKPFLEEAMHYNYLNLTAFSEYIRPYIERELQKEISIHAIKMALSRFELTGEWHMVPRSHGLSRISTRTGLSVLTLARTAKNIETVTQFMVEKRKSEKHFFTMIEWVHEIDLIFEHSLRSEILERIPQHAHILLVTDLALISGELSDAEISTPWLFYTVTKRLAFHGVNIIQVLSTYHELGIIIKEVDIKRALLVLMD